VHDVLSPERIFSLRAHIFLFLDPAEGNLLSPQRKFLIWAYILWLPVWSEEEEFKPIDTFLSAGLNSPNRIGRKKEWM